jgi:hypothetical protein
MDFMDIDYGKEHNTPWGQLPPGIDKVWIEPTENHGSYNFHPYISEIFNIEDNTKLVIGCGQDARYLENRKENIKNWVKIKPERIVEYEQILKFYDGMDLDDNTCVINVRGGEYKGIPSLLLQNKYWSDAINIMKEKSHYRMKFIVVTDDIGYAKGIFPYPVVHFSIGADYYLINQAKNLILSNSSFALFPAWLNLHNPFIIAPKYWARHNISTGYWASSNIQTFGFNFLDRDGSLS